MNALNLQALQNLPDPAFWLLLFIAVGFTLYFIYNSYKNLLKARAIEDHPTSKIRSAAQGYVELCGSQHFFEKRPIVAPLTKENCTWYAYKVEYYYPKGTRLMDSGKSTHYFILSDETGECVVDPQNAQVNTPCYDRWFGFTPKPNGKPKSLIMKAISRFGRYRYHEWRMSENMPLYAIGNFITLHKKSNSEMQQKDDQTFNLLTAKGLGKRTPFILSAYDQKKLAQQYRLQSIAWTLAYFITFCCAAILFFVKLS